MSFFEELKDLLVTEKNPQPSSASAAMTWLLKSFYFNTEKRAAFYRNVKVLTQGGVSIQTVLRLLKDLSYKHNKSDSAFRIILGDILHSMSQGLTYEQAIAKWIPYQERSLLEAANKNIREGAEVMATFSEHILSVKTALVGALVYPAVMFIILCIVVVAFSFFVVPSLYSLSDPQTWPTSAVMLDVFTSFIRNHSIAVLIMVVVLFSFVTWSLDNLRIEHIRSLFDRFPPWSIYKQYQATIFLICLSSLIKTGASYNNAVQYSAKTASPYLNYFLQKILLNLSRGSNFGESLDVNLFSGDLIVNTSIFALTNRLDIGVRLLAEEGLEEQSKSIVDKGKLLGYIMMTVVALTIGWIVLSVYGIQSTLA